MTLHDVRPARRTPLRWALRLLEAVDRHQGATPDTLARELDLPPSAVHHTAALLEQEGYLRGLDDGGYVLGSAMDWSDRGRERTLRAGLDRALLRLRDQLGAAVCFGRYRDGEIVVEAAAAGAGAPAVQEWVDLRAAGHATALGKCLLAQVDHRARQDHFARHPAVRLTSRTVTDTRILLHQLDRHPAAVPVLDLQEYAVGAVCAAVPLTAGARVGCLAVSLPLTEAHRLRRTAELLAARAAPVLLTQLV